MNRIIDFPNIKFSAIMANTSIVRNGSNGQEYRFALLDYAVGLEPRNCWVPLFPIDELGNAITCLLRDYCTEWPKNPMDILERRPAKGFPFDPKKKGTLTILLSCKGMVGLVMLPRKARKIKADPHPDARATRVLSLPARDA